MEAGIAPLPETPATSAMCSRQLFPPLEQVTRTVITTNEAAFYLNRKSQTLRIWACYEDGPLLPIRINGRLGWRVSDIKALLGDR